LGIVLIAILYTTAPAIAVFAKTNLIETVSDKELCRNATMVCELGKNRIVNCLKIKMQMEKFNM
jgi:Na+(H+)/acetate symporter ActP